MRMNGASLVLSASIVLVACMREQETEAVEPSTTESAGGLVTGEPGPQTGGGAAISAPQERAIPTGQALGQQVQAALREAPEVDESTIVVRVAGRSVYLAGWVRSEEEMRVARDVVQRVPGVDEVYTRELSIG